MTATPDAQECKRRAMECMDALETSKQRAVRQRKLTTDDRWNIAALLDEAQVWATLATVPDPESS